MSFVHAHILIALCVQLNSRKYYGNVANYAPAVLGLRVKRIHKDAFTLACFVSYIAIS